MQMTRRRWMTGASALLLLAAGGAALWYFTTQGAAARYQTARVDRGPIVATVSASGTLNAVTTVQVGSQVSGQIKELLADFNSRVRAGQLVARLDPEIFQAKVDAASAELRNAEASVLVQGANVEKARADVESARASVTTAEANVERTRADVENARAGIATARANVVRETATAANAGLELRRRVELLGQEVVSQSEKDQAQMVYDTAAAQLDAARSQQGAAEAMLRSAEAQLAALRSQGDAARAQLASARAALGVAQAQREAAAATVEQRRAARAQARLDLAHTEIRAPVDGVVISRAVDVGQTVAASLQAPTLFVIAQDLTRMQVEAAVDEADVGRLREALAVTFTVDAFPGRSFQGHISQIRKAAQVVQNVVTYTVIIAVANPDLTLVPGMTANVRVEVDRRENVLRIPNAALRVRVADAAGAAAARTAGADGAVGTPGRIFALAGGKAKAIPLVVGLSDGSVSEVVRGDLAPGAEVIVGQATAASTTTATPLRPRF